MRPLFETGRSNSQRHRWTPSCASTVISSVEGRHGLGDLPVTAVDAGDVAAGRVAADEHDRASQSGLDCCQDVETVDHQLFAGDERGLLPGEIVRRSRASIRAGRPAHGLTLALGQAPTIADQFERGDRRVAPPEQPGKVRHGPAQGRPARLCRKPRRRADRGRDEHACLARRAGLDR